MSYRRLRAGAHRFRVVASSSGASASRPASYLWTINLAPPGIQFGFPAHNGAADGEGWSAGCAQGTGVCGSATDGNGVRSVAVSILRLATGRYWDGAAFSGARERYLTAAMSRTATGARWYYRLPLPSHDGQYRVHVRAVDRLGNATSRRRPPTSTFTLDRNAPPAPSLLAAPANPTTDASATFAFADSEGGVRFECQLDADPPTPCTSAFSMAGLAPGSHSFGVRALDGAGNRSAFARYSWTIMATGGLPFVIAGQVQGTLYPGGGAHTLAATLTNPNGDPIFVTSLTASVLASSLPPGCPASGFQIGQADVASDHPVRVPANGSVTLPAQGVSAPSVTMLNLPVSQDACKAAAVLFSFSGSAHS